MFWVAGYPGGPDVIVESEERPRSISYGGDFARTSRGFQTLDDLRAVHGMTESCRECSSLIDTNWHEDTKQKLIAAKLCLSCERWARRVPEVANPSHVVVDGSAYWIEEDGPGSAHGFRGFGGAKFVVEFFDGRIVETRNLWHQGTVPPHFRERLPNNARFVR